MKKCTVEGCEKEQYKAELCRVHIARVLWDRKNEKWKAIYQIVFKHDNRIYFKDDHAVMIIINRAGDKSLILIDIDDIPLVNKHRWCQDSRGYAQSNINGRNVRLHRFLLQLPEGVLGDHKDGNVLDNRRNNIRPCNHQENSRNKGLMPNNKSGVPGVFWEEKRNKWLAVIGINRSTKHLGYFDDFNMAVEAREKAVAKYFGEFARAL